MLRTWLALLCLLLLAGCMPFSRTFPDPVYEEGQWQVAVVVNEEGRGGCFVDGGSLDRVESIRPVSFTLQENLTCWTLEAARRFIHNESTTYTLRVGGNFTGFDVTLDPGGVAGKLRSSDNLTLMFDKGNTDVLLTAGDDRGGRRLFLDIEWIRTTGQSG